jgi:flagellar hook-associated protein 3 FlgL
MTIARVGNNQMTDGLLGNIRSQLSMQEKIHQQISSNKNILKPSDDPIGTAKAMDLRDQLQRLEKYDKIVTSADVWTNVSSVSIDSATDTWTRVNEIAISSADGTKSAADRAGMAQELEQLLGHLVEVANTTHAGKYVFAGSKTDAPPFQTENDPQSGRVSKVYYSGNSEVREVKTNDRGSQALNVVGSNGGNPDVPGVFQDSNSGVDLFATIIKLRDKLLNNDMVGISGEGGVLEDVEKGAQSLRLTQVRIGGVQEALQLDKNRIIEQSANVEEYLSNVEDADTAKLILELNNLQNVYEASLAVGGRLFQTGLINFI